MYNNYAYPKQQQPMNMNIIPQFMNSNLYELKVLNENDEAENIFINGNTIFVGNGKMQIKKIDGTIEKYTLKKYYPIDEKDKRIAELEKQINDLKEVIANGNSKLNETAKNFNESDRNDDENFARKKSTNVSNDRTSKK